MAQPLPSDGGSMGIAWTGDPTQLPLGDTHKLLDASLDEDAPVFQPFGGKRSGRPLSIRLQSGHLGEVWQVWQTSMHHCIEL